jgi:Subtilase family
MALMRDWCVVPNDTLFAQQWGMTQIQAPQAWDISTGNNAVVVAILDSGTDLTHPDLVLAGPGIDLGDMISDGSPNSFGPMTGHGTSCSGISAATFNNAAGVTGSRGHAVSFRSPFSTLLTPKSLAESIGPLRRGGRNQHELQRFTVSSYRYCSRKRVYE